MRTRDLVLALVVGSLAACGEPSKPSSAPTSKPGTPPASSGIPVSAAPTAAEHSHEAKHGGAMLELGAHEGHVEVVHDPKAGTLTAYVYDLDMKPAATEPPVINLTKGGIQVAMTPLAGVAATSDAWKATHEALKVDPLEGRIRVKLGDRTYQVAIVDEHDHK